MMRHGSRPLGLVGLLAIAWLAAAPPAHAVSLDKKGDIKLGVRVYTAARVGSEHTDKVFRKRPSIFGDDVVEYKRFTFPVSPAGHLRQHRYFAEAEFSHDLRRLMKRGFGPLSLIQSLPVQPSMLRYRLVYRGEGEGIYDYGPREYRTSEQYFDDELSPPLFGNVIARDRIARRERNRLRDRGVVRNRLFQAFFDVQFGELFVRVGRQILVWGETDAFRLIDNINPLDSSFGGFLISLDERRVPLDMVRANYYLGNLGPISEAFVEAYIAIDNKVGYGPGVGTGTAWGLPNLDTIGANLEVLRNRPARTFSQARGGGMLKFNAPLPGVGDATFSLVHYYTYLDIPAVQTFTCEVLRPDTMCTFPQAFPEGSSAAGFLALAIMSGPRVQITGASSSFVIPAHLARRVGLGGEPVVRMELAYFRHEPRFSQSQLDPFIFNFNQGLATGERRLGSSWNFVLGIDMNQYIRWLNSRNSFLFSTQFFFKHLNGAQKRRPWIGFDGNVVAMDGEVLPVPGHFQIPTQFLGTPLEQSGPAQYVFVRHPVNQYLQTLMIGTSYYSGQVVPDLTLFYDWSGSFAAIAGVTFSRDPFRFRVEYDFIESNDLRGSSGTSLLRDRDNILFQLEYVI